MDKYTIITDNGNGLFAQRLNDVYAKVCDYLKEERQAGRILH